jgi:hypothetical protein
MDDSQMENASPSLAGDLLTGASAIAAYLGWPERRVYYFAEKKHLPIGRVGSMLVARRSQLDRALTSCMEAA